MPPPSPISPASPSLSRQTFGIQEIQTKTREKVRLENMIINQKDTNVYIDEYNHVPISKEQI